jgi:predicted MPP superfamily phosphohydrolase
MGLTPCGGGAEARSLGRRAVREGAPGMGDRMQMLVGSRAVAHTIRILHLSDIHERGERERENWRRKRVLGDKWWANLAELVTDGRAIDLICFTGDLADWGRPDEYAALTPFVERVLRQTAVPKDRLFLVPGNHDIDRTIEKAAWQHLRESGPRTSRSALSRFVAGREMAPLGIDPNAVAAVIARQGAYRNWIDDLGRPELIPTASAHGRLGYRVTVPRLPCPVHVIGLDSAWLAGDDHDAGKLLLTENQVGSLVTDKAGQTLPGYRLALVHHPIDDLADKGDVVPLLADNVDLVLRGHLHEASAEERVDPDRRLRVLAAGSLYDGGDGNRWPNGHQVIDIELDTGGRPLAHEVRFRSWAGTKAFWYDDAGVYLGAPQGRLRWGRKAAETKVAPYPSMEELTKRHVVLEKLLMETRKRGAVPTVLSEAAVMAATIPDLHHEAFFLLALEEKLPGEAVFGLGQTLILLVSRRGGAGIEVLPRYLESPELTDAQRNNLLGDVARGRYDSPELVARVHTVLVSALRANRNDVVYHQFLKLNAAIVVERCEQEMASYLLVPDAGPAGCNVDSFLLVITHSAHPGPFLARWWEWIRDGHFDGGPAEEDESGDTLYEVLDEAERSGVEAIDPVVEKNFDRVRALLNGRQADDVRRGLYHLVSMLDARYRGIARVVETILPRVHVREWPDEERPRFAAAYRRLKRLLRAQAGGQVVTVSDVADADGGVTGFWDADNDEAEERQYPE